MPDEQEKNVFTQIFEDMWKQDYKDRNANKLECVRKGLDNDNTFYNMNADQRKMLPAFAAWVAEEIKALAPTQLRRFYSYVKSIERNATNDGNGLLDATSQAKLLFLLPKLAGNANVKRKKEKQSIQALYDVFATCIYKNEKIRSTQDIECFVEFFEAILDYHATFDHKKDKSGGESDDSATG